MKNEEKIKWKPGDVAICIKVGPLTPAHVGDPPPLRLNLEYPVHAVKVCECGNVQLDVGLYTPTGQGTRCNCGAYSRPNTGIHWANAVRFTKKKTAQDVEAELAEALENEDYVLATKLRDHGKS